MPLSKEVGLSPSDTVLDGDPVSPLFREDPNCGGVSRHFQA